MRQTRANRPALNSALRTLGRLSGDRVMHEPERGLSLNGVQVFNRSVILSAIYQLGVCSRKEISDATGLDQATVTRALTPLIEADLVEEIGFIKGARGRRSISLRLSTRRFRIISAASSASASPSRFSTSWAGPSSQGRFASARMTFPPQCSSASFRS